MRITILDYIKGIKKGNREAELYFESGFISNNKIYKSKKKYNRKNKHKNNEE